MPLHLMSWKGPRKDEAREEYGGLCLLYGGDGGLWGLRCQ